MSFALIIGLVVALAVVIAARRRRPRVTRIEHKPARKDGDDA